MIFNVNNDEVNLTIYSESFFAGLTGEEATMKIEATRELMAFLEIEYIKKMLMDRPLIINGRQVDIFEEDLYLADEEGEGIAKQILTQLNERGLC